MPAPSYLSALDIGTARTRALIAAVDHQSGELSLAGWGEVPSQGLEHGMIVNVSEATASMTQAVQAAEAMADQPLEHAYVGIAGSHVQTAVSPSTLARNRSQPISPADMQQVLQQARQIRLKENHQILHTLAGLWMVDDQFHVRYPVGMHAASLGVEALIVSASSTAIGNLMQCAAALRIDVEELVLAPLASSQATLTPDEKQMGVALVDIGAGTTDLIVFQQGHVQFAQSLAMGGDSFSHDMATLLHCPGPVAEQLKCRHGAALPSAAGHAEVKAQVFGDQGEVAFSTRFLCQILAARAQQLWEHLDALLRQAGFRHSLPAGIVLTGGASQLRHLNDSCRAHFKLPVRTAPAVHTLPVHHLQPDQRSPACTALLGLLLWGVQARQAPIAAPAALRPEKPLDWRHAVRNALAHFLPG